jgi:hypothetical protein
VGSGGAIFAVGAVADAPPATAKVPAAPKNGNTFRQRFSFEACLSRAMGNPPFVGVQVLGQQPKS